jgi:hypothetical protein
MTFFIDIITQNPLQGCPYGGAAIPGPVLWWALLIDIMMYEILHAQQHLKRPKSKNVT